MDAGFVQIKEVSEADGQGLGAAGRGRIAHGSGLPAIKE